jgi:four helix bundle protein
MALQIRHVALDSIALMRPLAERIARRDRSLAQQLRRSASSMVLNIGEAERSDPGTERSRLFSAAGSANETRTALQVALAWGYIDQAHVAHVEQKLDRVVATLYKLTRGTR